MRSRRTAACLAVMLAAGCSGPEGDPGPMGPAGPPGDTVRGVSYVAHFDRLSDLDTWEYTAQGEWRVDAGELVVRAGPAELAVIGPGSEFANDIDVSVVLRPLSGSGEYGLRFCATQAQAYWLSVSAGQASVYRESEAGQTSVIAAVASPGLQGTAEVRVMVRDRTISLYVDGALLGRGEDPGPRQGRVQVFVRGVAEVAFDDLWVHTALPLL